MQHDLNVVKCLKTLTNTINKGNGDVAQLARALDWQSRGRRFESDLLHFDNQRVIEI